jgi:adenylate cyclase
MNSIWQRLRERKLVQWGVAYLAGAWLVLQVATLLGGQFELSPGLLRGFTVVLAIGFFATLVIAWYHGERGQQSVTAAEFLMLTALLVIAGGVVRLVNPGEVPVASEPVAATPAAAPGEAAPDFGASVAVLPFDNLGGGPENDYFSEGITDEIIRELAKVQGLKVISRTSVVALKGTRLTLPQIAETLGVRHVVEGTVRRAGDQVRITAQLIDPATDTHLWAETFDRQLLDIFKVQEEIARHVSGELLTRVEGLTPRSPASRTEQTAAYDAYLRGSFARSRPTPAGLQTAMAAFEEAIALDENYAPAYAGLAAVHVMWALFAYPTGPDPYENARRALALAEQAVALDEYSAEARGMRGHARLRTWQPIEMVLADLTEAVRLAPNAGELRVLHAVGLAFAGRFDEAVEATEAAVALDPLAPGHHDFRAVTLNLVGRHEEAIREARTALALEPRFVNPRRQEARALLLLGRYEECAALDLGPYHGLRAMCLHSAGATEEARTIITKLGAAVRGDASILPLQPGALGGDLAEFHAWIGDVDGTLAWLEWSADHSPIHQFLVTESATYDKIREDARFQREFARIRDEIIARLEGGAGS